MFNYLNFKNPNCTNSLFGNSYLSESWDPILYWNFVSDCMVKAESPSYMDFKTSSSSSCNTLHSSSSPILIRSKNLSIQMKKQFCLYFAHVVDSLVWVKVYSNGKLKILWRNLSSRVVITLFFNLSSCISSFLTWVDCLIPVIRYITILFSY